MTTGYEVCRTQIKAQVMALLQNSEVLEDDLVYEQIEGIAQKFAGYRLLKPQDKARMVKEVFNSIRKMDLLEELLEQQDITEIMLNSYDNIFVERNGRIERYEGQFESEERYMDIIQQIVAKCNRVVNGANPIVDARLEDGSRVNVVLSPISLQGTAMTIRHFQEKPLQMEDLIRMGSITRECAEFLQKLVVAKYNIFISGGTGAGKTSFLNILSGYIPEEERIITLEDSAELKLQNTPNLVRLETRNSNGQECRAITMRDLIKTSLRMRPSRIIVGEVRGEECIDMLQAMNTGHDGSLSTGHANSTEDMLSRLETMVLQGASGLPLEAIRHQIGSAIDIIIHLSRLRDKSRKTMEITEVVGYKDGEIILNPLYVFEEDEKSTLEKVSGSLVRTKNPLQNDFKLKLSGIKTKI